MNDNQEYLPLSPTMQLMHDRLCSTEALLVNIYTKYYLEQYQNASSKAKESMRRAQKDKYSLYMNYSFIDGLHECRVRNLIKQFFANLDSIISMDTTNGMDTTNRNLLSFLHAEDEGDGISTPQYKAKVQTLIQKRLPQFSPLVIDQIYRVAPSSDLVLRVWLKDAVTHQPVTSLILKTLGANGARNDIVDKYGLFYREASFYSSLADPVRDYTPICYYSSIEESLLIMQDKGEATVGDQLYGYTSEEALDVIDAIIHMHEFWFKKQPDCFLQQVNDQQMTDIIPEMLIHAWAVSREFLNPENSPTIDAIVHDLAVNIKSISDELSLYPTVIHGDLRMENLLFRGAKLDSIVDWQLLAIGSPMIDVAYFLVQSGCKEERLQIEDQVIDLYSKKFLHLGMDRARCLLEYHLAIKHSLIIPIMVAACDLHEFGKPRNIVTSAFQRTIEAIG